MHYSFSGLQAGFSFEVIADPVTGLLSFVALTAGSAVPEPALPGLLLLAGLGAWVARRAHRAPSAAAAAAQAA